MSFENLSKEQQILVAMRKTLTNIARETAPQPGMLHPLSEQTVQDMRMCLALISAREKELTDERGIENNMRPHFVDEPKSSHVVSLDQIKRQRKDSET